MSVLCVQSYGNKSIIPLQFPIIFFASDESYMTNKLVYTTCKNLQSQMFIHPQSVIFTASMKAHSFVKKSFCVFCPKIFLCFHKSFYLCNNKINLRGIKRPNKHKHSFINKYYESQNFFCGLHRIACRMFRE